MVFGEFSDCQIF